MAVEYLIGCITAASHARSDLPLERIAAIKDYGTDCLMTLGVTETEMVIGIMSFVGNVQEIEATRKAAEAVQKEKEGQSSAQG